ncbi:MAG: Crp/Fnr family transcriptional regulator [Chloroflexota bacterium]|nr:Crp/Fnr family transcriptional regulator [Chloroflexota bacterium]
MPDFPVLPYLRQLPYFEQLDTPVLEQLAAQAARHTFAAGETLFIEGDAAAGLWMIESGRIKIYKLNADGQEHILRIFGERDTFNDIGAFDAGSNPANAASLSDAVLWVLPSAAVRDLILRDGAFALRVIQVLSGRVRGLIRQIEDLTLYSVTVRLARLLLKQAEDPALSGPGVTRAAIAAHLATTPQTISTALRELEGTGAIAFDRHQIQIVREDLLRSIAML